jgi:hypothetical protein
MFVPTSQPPVSKITLFQVFLTADSTHSPVTITCVHKPVSSHTSPCTPCVYVLACILHMFHDIGDYTSVRNHMASDNGTAVLLNVDPELGQSTREPCQVKKYICWKHKWCKIWSSNSSVAQDSSLLEYGTVSLSTHWLNISLKDHRAFTFRVRLFILDCSTLEDEGTFILQNVGNYSPTGSVKSSVTPTEI